MIRSDLALAALATAAVPGMRPVSVAAVRSGEDNPLHQSALVEDVTGRKWVVRSPLGAAAGAELERNDALTHQLSKHLPFKVPAAAGYADLGQDGRAAVYPYVEGLALDLRHLPTGPGLASAVGRAIAAVHNMPRELFEEHSVPVFDAAQFRSRKLAELDRAAETGHVPNGLLARWEQALEAAPMWQFTTTPSHGSLDGSSFLVVFSEDDAASGRVVGMIGWERAQVADPADDFAYLVERSNPRAVDAVFESYSMARSQRPDGYLLNRARLASEMRLLHDLTAAVGTGDQGFVRSRADELRKMDRLTANDDSLVPRTALVAPATPPTPSDVTLGSGGVIANGGADITTDNATAAIADNSEENDEPVFVVEPAPDASHMEPAHPQPSEPAVSPTNVTAPIPRFRPIGPAPAQAATGVSPSDPSEDDRSLPDDIESESEKSDLKASEPESEPTAPVSTEDVADAEEPNDAESAGNEADSAEANGGETDSAATDGSETDSAEPVGGEPTDTSEAQDTAEEAPATDRELADRATDERLHTLYGMPDDAAVDSSGADGR